MLDVEVLFCAIILSTIPYEPIPVDVMLDDVSFERCTLLIVILWYFYK